LLLLRLWFWGFSHSFAPRDSDSTIAKREPLSKMFAPNSQQTIDAL
jgi:hypothetical protein